MTGLACLPEISVNDQNPEDDRELLQLMQAGEEQAFVVLYRKYQPAVYRFCLHVSGSQQVAEDATQDTFITLMRKSEKYDVNRGPLLLYLFGIARRLVWTGRRQELRRHRMFTSLEEKEGDLSLAAPDLLSHFAKNEQITQVQAAVLSLPRRYREVIALCALEELSYEQTAKVVGCSVGTIRSRMYRAKKILFQKLNEIKLGQSVQRSSALRYEP